ncbi:MAG TPA: class I SAM-dependent methyltransferase [Pseudolysinimonas sp.]|jgi:SAM-dependent methyltransferase
MDQNDADAAVPPTAGKDYAERLVDVGQKRWKKILNVQAPFKAHIRHLKLGRTLDVGCGTGRNLHYLSKESVGVDHNPYSVQVAREAGLTAYQSDDFFADASVAVPRGFDSMLAAHVVEHLEKADARMVLGSYLPMIKPGGRVVLITPQERGHYGGFDHISFSDFDALSGLVADLGLLPEKHYSFPFPRFAGRFFNYNEFVSVSKVPTA